MRLILIVVLSLAVIRSFPVVAADEFALVMPQVVPQEFLP